MCRINLISATVQVSLDEQDFKDETVKALTRKNLGLSNFVYSSTRTGSKLELTWKKHIISDNIKFLLGSVTFDLIRNEGASSLLEFAVSALEEYDQEVSDLKKENHRLASERQGALARLKKCANLQQDIEKDLFGKFKVVLNEKKAKIRKVMEQLGTVSGELNSMKQSASKNTTIATAPTTSEAAPVNHGDNETDDEIVHSPSPMATSERVSPAPRVHESLLGDPADKTVSSPPVKRRKRNVAGTSKVKGHPVELPRPPSVSRSSSGRQSMDKVKVRKSSSDSKRSEESMESDELLQLL